MPETPEGRRPLPATLSRTIQVPDPPPVDEDTMPPGGPVEPVADASSTEPVAAPAGASPLVEVLALATREAEATRDPARAADLWARVALLAWDLGDTDAAAAAAARARQHPIAARLLVGHALAVPTAQHLAAAETAARESAGFTAELAVELVEARLFRAGDADGAALAGAAASDPAGQELGSLALALAGNWEALAQRLGDRDDASPHDLHEAAHIRGDRLGDTARAAAILHRARAAADDPYPHEHLLELALVDPEKLDLPALIGEKLEALGAGADADPAERAAMRFLLAESLERAGRFAEAGAQLVALAPDAGVPWGGRVALHLRRRIALRQRAWSDAAETSLELSRAATHPGLARAWLRRAAELTDARVGDAERAAALYAELLAADPSDAVAARALLRLRLKGRGRREAAALAAQLEAGARTAAPPARAALLRRAAAVAESRLGDLAAAVRLRLEALSGGADLASLEELARLHRRQGDRARLAWAYRQAALLSPHDDGPDVPDAPDGPDVPDVPDVSDGDVADRLASVYLTAAGCAELGLGAPKDAEATLREAVVRAPGDVVARLALAVILRGAGRWRELAELMDGVASLAAHDALRAASLRELGRITATRLGDPRGARAHLERALELAPGDAGILEALAVLVGDTGDFAQAVTLRERAVEIVVGADPGRAAGLLLEIGDIEEHHRKDDEAARVAYEGALALDDEQTSGADTARGERMLRALRALGALHRKAKRSSELLKVLRRELGVTTDAQRRLALLLEIARNADQVEGDVAAALEGYRAVLAIDPANSPALAGIERICRRDGRWELLAEALRAAPRSPRNLRTLGEALEKLERWAELAEVRRQEMEGNAVDRKEAARAAMALATLLEDKLADLDGAIRVYRRGYELEPTDVRPLRALARLLESRGAWSELVDVLEKELAALAHDRPGAAGAHNASLENARRVGLLLRIGEIRRDRLDRLVEAASAYESVLELDGKNPVALAALELAYQRLGRDGELLRVLERKAELSEDPAARAEDFARIAEIRERRGDIDAALACYREAFLADPSNRNTFTALERLCYKRERWREAMELYESAITLVETGKSRAYRLGDLYARKGQIQLSYLGQQGQAAASYLKVIELDPENDTSLRFLETIYSQEGDWEKLIQAYEKRADLTADDERRIETLRRAARVAASKRRELGEAARLYERILAIDSSDGEALDALERFYDKAKEHAKLVNILTMRMSTAPAGDAAVALLMRIAGICEEGLRDEGRATLHYKRILEIAPGSKEALDALGRIYESTEKWPEFIDVTRRLIRITTDRNLKALLYFKCGSVMESKFGKEEDAIRYYDAAIKTSPSCLPAVHGLRDLYLRRKDWQKVLSSLELEVKLWQDDKERAGVFAQIGHIYGDFLNDPDRAQSFYENAISVDPDCLPANRALFEIFFARGEWGRAAPLGQALAQKAMREGDPAERSEFYRKRGIVAWHARDVRAGAESFIISLEIKPENLAALDDLGRLARAEPDAYDFPATYRELEKLYRKRDDTQPHLARVLVANAAMLERAGDLDAAERGYREALAWVPEDFTVLSALVDLNVNMRRMAQAAQTITAFLAANEGGSTGGFGPGAGAGPYREGGGPVMNPGLPRETRVRALLRLAEIHGDGEMDPHTAIGTLREVLRLDPQHQDAHYRLAQELSLAGRYPEARQHIEACIEIAAAPTSPSTPPSPEALARYYYYLGRIVEAMGDARSAGSQYRRAAEYDPAYGPTALALAKRAVAAGDRRSAENTLISAAHAAIKKGGQRAAVPLQRGLARILLAAGERSAAIEAYRGILAVEPQGADDRVALAEIYAMEDVPKAIVECHRVLDRDLRHPPCYRLLASLYERLGEPERAARVNGIFELLGYAEEQDRMLLAQARARQLFMPRRSMLGDELRQTLLLPAAAKDRHGQLLTELYGVVAADIIGLFAMPGPGANLTPAPLIDDPAFKLAISDNARLFGVEPEVYVGDEVPGGVVALTHPRPVVVLSRSLYGRSDRERRFLLGRAYESLRGGYAPLLRMTARERAEVGTLLKSLLLPDAERPPAAQELVKQLPRKTQKAIERFVIPSLTAASLAVPAAASSPPQAAFGSTSAGAAAGKDAPSKPQPPVAHGPGSEHMPNADAWMAALALAEDRAGILACDDFSAAARCLAILSGEELAVTPDGAVALGAVPGGSDLVRYFLSDDYHRLRLALSEPAVKPVT